MKSENFCTKYKKTVKSTFVERINRFVAKVILNGNEETVHIKNTGRCKELFVPGTNVYLSYSDKENRKTKYDLVAVLKKDNNKVVNVDSQIPNTVAAEWISASALFSENAIIRKEVNFMKSRFDLYIEDGSRKAFIEVKGVTLEENGVALFPDAPTKRGVKHLYELVAAKKLGYEAYILFVIQMEDISVFTPNFKTDTDFANALKFADENGVRIIAINCMVAPNDIKAKNVIPVIL